MAAPGGRAALLRFLRPLFALTRAVPALTRSAWRQPSTRTRSSSLSGSPQSQLKIGKSIFFNERINTTTSGLVQVLLVDGSTFTVGPGSDLVIDKFVYDSKKKSARL